MNKIVIANWKMSQMFDQTVATVKAVTQGLPQLPPGKEAVICPSAIALTAVKSLLQGTAIDLGVQNMFWEERGAYTGEISPLDVAMIGARYVILGHSERRKYLSETNELVHKKTEAALKNGLIPIVCIGESWEERAEGQAEYVILRQLNEIFNGIHISPKEHVIIAYEPVWAISSSGGGVYAKPEEVEYVKKVIRQSLLDMYDAALTDTVFRVVYGGSVTSQTVAAYTNIEGIAGVLVGSASLKADEFIKIIQNA